MPNTIEKFEMILNALMAIGILLLILSYPFGIRKLLDKGITNPKKTIGTVIGASPLNYAGHHTARVRYAVDGQEYTVDGPLFRYGNTNSLAESNLTDRNHLPNHLVAKNIVFPSIEHETQSNDYLYNYSAISKLYPIGSTADVWYDPANPSNAYVERYILKGFLPTILLAGAGTSITIIAALIKCLI